MKEFSELIIKYRGLILALMTIITILWVTFLPKLNIVTSFAELLPQTHPYIRVHRNFEETFGGANFLVMLLEVKEGDIFNRTTLEKIQYITEELGRIKYVDRYKIISIAQKKLKTFRYTSWGIESFPLMWPDIPANEKEMQKLRESIYTNPRYYGGMVSHDCKRTLITADFLEEELDYSIVYNQLNRIRDEVEKDGNHILSIVGYPMHIGTIRHMVKNVNYILMGTAIVIPILLFLAYRSVWATFLVPAAGLISCIWGLGFMGMMGYNLDPLVFVMPFLIALMAFRHSHQLYNRFYEECIAHGDKLRGARTVIEEMFPAGLTSVITDAFGIAIVTIVPIPLLRNVAIACTFWSIITVFIGLIFTPIMMTYVPISASFLKRIEHERKTAEKHLGWVSKFADWLGPWLIAKRGRYTVIVFVLIILGFSYYWSEQLIVGDAAVGSNYLYDSSRYNQDSIRINQTHPIINPLYVIVSGGDREAIKNVEIFKEVYNFNAYMLQHSGAIFSQDLIQSLMSVTQGMHGNDPKWYGFPDTNEEALQTFTVLATSGDPGDMDRFIDYHDQYTNITLYYGDKTGPTINKAMSAANEYVKQFSKLGEIKNVEYKLAGGVIGVEAAINEVVAEKQLQTLLLALMGVFVFCMVHFRSFKVGLSLMIPLALSNFIAFAYMAINQIGLSISTLPVSAAGIGMGVDYGIYLVARLAEEKRKGPSISANDALIRTIQSYGKSIIYIAGTLVLGLLVWVLSPLKFQAQMGMMLAVILFLNCLGSIFLVPVLVLLFKPRFLYVQKTIKGQ